MPKVLVKWGTCWSDEIEIEGFCIIDEEKLKIHKQEIAKYTEPFTISIGTNQEEFYEDGQKLLDEISEEPLTDFEAEVIERKVGRTYGQIRCFDYPFRKYGG